MSGRSNLCNQPTSNAASKEIERHDEEGIVKLDWLTKRAVFSAGKISDLAWLTTLAWSVLAWSGLGPRSHTASSKRNWNQGTGAIVAAEAECWPSVANSHHSPSHHCVTRTKMRVNLLKKKHVHHEQMRFTVWSSQSRCGVETWSTGNSRALPTIN